MFLELLRKRRSVRKFEAKEVEREKMEVLVEAMLRSPSSRSTNPWEFVVVDDPDILKKLSRAKAHGASFIAKAPLAIAVCADPQKCDVWVEDCSIAAILIHLTAADLGLGSCWVQLRLRQREGGGSASGYAAGVLGLKEGREVLAVIAVGYPAEHKEGHLQEDLLWERVSHNRYGKTLDIAADGK